MSVWDEPGVVDELLRLRNEGLSASQIARRMSATVSRNAVISKLHRLGVGLADKQTDKVAVVRRVVARTRPAGERPQGFGDLRQFGRPPRAPRAAPQLPPAPPRLRGVEVAGPGRTLVELGCGMCRWPLDLSLAQEADARSLFCGAPVPGDDRQYCRAHEAIAFLPTSSAAELTRGLRRYA